MKKIDREQWRQREREREKLLYSARNAQRVKKNEVIVERGKRRETERDCKRTKETKC